jgi:hypothetical protein
MPYNYRINTSAVAFVVALVAILFGVFGYTWWQNSNASISEAVETETEHATQDMPAPDARRITVQYQYADGLHTVAGTAQVPTPCHEIVAEPVFLDNETVAELQFSTIADTAVMCAAVVSDAPFFVSFRADEDIALRARWNGEPVHLNIVPVGAGETLSPDFDVKG